MNPCYNRTVNDVNGEGGEGGNGEGGNGDGKKTDRAGETYRALT